MSRNPDIIKRFALNTEEMNLFALYFEIHLVVPPSAAAAEAAARPLVFRLDLPALHFGVTPIFSCV